MSAQGTKEMLLQTALELFAMQGYDATSTRQIASSAGANLSAISYHFGSKEGLYKAVFLHCFECIEHIVKNSPQKPLDRLSHYALQMGQLHQKQPFIARFLIITVTSQKPFMKEIFTQCQGKLFAFFIDTFEQGIENGEFKRDLNVQSAIISFISIVNFYFFISQFETIPKGLDKLKSTYATNALDIFLNGIKA